MNEITINLKKIKENILNINKNIYAVVKSNAYNHGIQIVSNYIEKYVEGFFVGNVDEGVLMREYGIKKKIIVLEKNPNYNLCLLYCLDVCINDTDDLINIPEQLKFHLNINTGMNRYGVEYNDNSLNNILSDDRLISVFTHIGNAKNKMRLNNQLKKFKKIKFNLKHYANSQTFKLKNKINPIRIGNLIYGLDKNQSFSLNTKISKIRKLKKGNYLGYNNFKLKEDIIVGIIPLGYSHGFMRSNSGGFVFINNKRYLIIGDICMEHTFIKIDNDVTQFDVVEVIGDNISLREVAKRNNTIVYEVPLLLKNIKYKYIK